MKLSFRPLRLHEIRQASQLVDAVYAPQIRKLYGNTKLGAWRHYDEAKLESYIAREAQGVRAGVWREQIITLNICRSYGSLGWFHTLAVHPDLQNRGLGRQAVLDAELYLAGQEVSSIALMTWPTAIKNLAFYQSLGYRPVGLSIYTYRQTHSPLVEGSAPFYAQRYASIPPAELPRAQNAIRALCQRLALGLDYLPWVTWAQQQDFADTLLLWRNGELQALAIFYFFPRAHWAEGKLLLLHPALSPDERMWALEHMRMWARSHQRDAFGLPVALNDDFLRNHLLPAGFRLYPESMVNMVKGASPPHTSHHFVRFGG